MGWRKILFHAMTGRWLIGFLVIPLVLRPP